MMKKLLMCLIAMTAIPAIATVLVTDDFAYTDALTNNGWVAHSGAGNKVIMSDGSVATLEQSGGSGEDVNLSFTALGATDKVYVGIDVTLPSGQTVNPDASGLYFTHVKDSSFGFRARTFVLAPASGGDFTVGLDADDSSPEVSWGADLAFDTTYRLVYSYDAATGFSDLWVNPANESSTKITSPTGTTGTLIEAVALRQSNDYTGSQLIGDVRVATTFNEALIPEPSTLILLGLGGLAMALRRRR